MKSLLVTSNCQTPGLVSCLRTLLPDWNVEGTTTHIFHSDDGRQELRERLNDCDVWVTSADTALRSLYCDMDVDTVIVPSIRFCAFHPDIIIFRDGEGNVVSGPTESDYHSRIVVAAYRLGLDTKKAMELFDENILESLGYFDIWDQEITALKDRFQETDIDADLFLPAAFRLGVFMHSHNHPKIGAVSAICRQVSARVGGAAQSDVGLLPDPLASAPGWPVYPSIALRFGELGSYVWRCARGRFVSSLDQFIEQAYCYYDEKGLREVLPDYALSDDQYAAIREAA